MVAVPLLKPAMKVILERKEASKKEKSHYLISLLFFTYCADWRFIYFAADDDDDDEGFFGGVHKKKTKNGREYFFRKKEKNSPFGTVSTPLHKMSHSPAEKRRFCSEMCLIHSSHVNTC